MVKTRKILSLILAIVIFVGVLTSCAKEKTEEAVSTAVPSEAPAEETTGTPAEAPTAVPTEESTEEPTAAPTAIPAKDPTKEPTDAPAKTPTKEPAETSAPTAAPEVVLISDTSENVSVIAEIKQGSVISGSVTPRDESLVAKHNSRLCIPYDSSASYGIGLSTWTTCGFDDTFYGDNYIKSQISADCMFASSGSGQWMGAFFGLFKNDVAEIADVCTGMYISFNTVTSSVTAYIPCEDKWNWPEGNVTVEVPSKLLQNNVHVDILATNDKTVYVYLKNTLVMTVTYDDVCNVYDGSGNKVYTSEYDENLISGKYFGIFSHLGGVGISNMKLYVQTDGTDVPTEPMENVGLDITNKTDLVGICYTMWFNAIHGNGTKSIADYPHNVTEYLEKYGSFTKEEGFGEGNNNMTAFHYWAKPAQGYYRSSDKTAHRNNLDLIGKAGVDFLILDYTYATGSNYAPGSNGWRTYIYLPTVALLETITEMRAEGKTVPYVVFWVNDNTLFEYFKSYFLNQSKWKDCFVYWNGKPFMLTWMYKESYLDDDLTIYGMYGLQGKSTEKQWSYLEVDNSKASSKMHISVSVATQETYMSYPTAHGRNGGKFWYNQWVNAFKLHPKIVSVTWWNEWCAQLYYFEGAGYVFTDNFNQEYSRDIEPMEGGHGDQYYQWLCSYVSAYKNGESCPKNYN